MPKLAGRRYLGLGELNQFAADLQVLNVLPGVSDDADLEKAASARCVDECLEFDLSHVSVWNVAALLWLSILLGHCRALGYTVLLRLPESTVEMDGYHRRSADKSADYLRRMRFDRALDCLCGDSRAIMVPEQAEYFDGNPREFYKAAEIMVDGERVELVSNSLLEINSVVGPASGDAVDDALGAIREYIGMSQQRRAMHVLLSQCGMERWEVEELTKYVIPESLLNIHEHSGATMGLVALSYAGHKHLELAVVDNGMSISRTIFDTYVEDQGAVRLTGKGACDKDWLSVEARAILTHYATQYGVTRKRGLSAVDAGRGLTRVKEICVDNFGGDFVIVTDGVSLKYTRSSAMEPKVHPWTTTWPGNLLVARIPFGR